MSERPVDRPRSFEDVVDMVIGRRGGDRGEKLHADKIAPASVQPKREEYSPWGKDIPTENDAIELRWRNGNWKIIYWHSIVGADGTGDTLISLLCTFCSVVIKGHHLGELRHFLKARKVDYVEEFNPGRWPAPKEDEPFIDEIKVLGLDGEAL